MGYIDVSTYVDIWLLMSKRAEAWILVHVYNGYR